MTATLTFQDRHIGPDSLDIATMLRAIGVPSVAELIRQTVPQSILPSKPLPQWEALSEVEALAQLNALASQNQLFTSLIGQGYHGTVLPAVIQRNLLENPAWYTAYTPYQPEISQGRLESLLNFQTLVTELTGLDFANASLLDEATAAAEAMALARRVSKVKTNVFYVDENTHPQTIEVITTRAEPLGWQVQVGPLDALSEAFGVLISYPGSDGTIIDPRAIIQAAKARGTIVTMAADPMALVLLTPPGELGADIAIGSMQRFGVPMGYGGPHAAYMAVKDAFKRDMPGRIVGVSLDAAGRPAYRLALQTREQHIRREKATSNICTAQVLLANIAAMYAVYHGPEGLTDIAESIHLKTSVLALGLKRLGFEVTSSAYFDALKVSTRGQQAEVAAQAIANLINFRIYPDGEHIGIALDETTTNEIVEKIWAIFGAELQFASLAKFYRPAMPDALKRRIAPVRHPIFGSCRSETAMLRYLRKLADRDLALDRAMIPLGSCTMKLNATTEMLPITWPEFSQLHPFAPADQAQGYAQMFETLEQWLCNLTGYDAVSLQPNSGAQGEYAGLLAIRAYHQARGQNHRTVCLIPSSAHGTNPASAHMAGMSVVVVGCDTAGNIDVADLKAKAELHSEKLAAVMVTYPSTHGVFETSIVEICEVIHAHGGQVYLDGANLNAQVGVTRPGDYGADVSHLNLHKTFCIPHGGGGPGMGPIGVKAHLAPYLPGKGVVGAVSAAPYGSASILPISYAYVLMMGSKGITQATEIAILSANYIAAKLDPHFPVLYKNAHGRVAHECIIDPRGLKTTSGVTVDDIAKRLIDYGFHAPTMSFPVAGTLMIEPTESEPKTEIDRFISAMIAIRQEIAAVESGVHKIEESALRHAPHTAEDLTADEWARPYSRRTAAYPAGQTGTDKYWPPVSRVDNVYGDRNLVCTCPPMEDYALAAE